MYRNEEVHHDEGDEHLEGDEDRECHGGSTLLWPVPLEVRKALLLDAAPALKPGAVPDQLLPQDAGGHAPPGEKRVAEAVEVGAVVQRLPSKIAYIIPHQRSGCTRNQAGGATVPETPLMN